MFRLAILLGAAILMILPACAMRESKVSQREPVASTPQATAQQPVGVAGQQAQQQPQAQQQQQAQAQQPRQTNEFMGVAPKVEDIPETIVLKAKNGNVTFPHQAHAKTMDCATCHQGTPGPIADFGKDKAHALCTGCHKEKNAGPTKCSECHKKS